MTKLRIADNLALPVDAVTSTIAVMGIRGSGKTHMACVLVEEMLKAGQPVCVYDPTGAWFGLKSSRDGRGPGFPVVVFGGEHPDVPLEETAGETVARVVVERRIPAILDCSLMRKGARVRFMQDFCETLYHRNREPLHFVCDEVHTIAPQKPLPEVARLLGAMEDIVLQGRRRGLGLTVISQRPALVNTNIRTQCATLIAMRVIGPHDRAALKEWTDAHGTPEQAAELLSSLATLKTGEGWVWSPAWLGVFTRQRFRQRETFDSSATPEVGKRVMSPKVVAEIDLAALGNEIRATVEKAKENDPRELRRKIQDLERQLRDRPAERVEVERFVEVPVLNNGQLEKLTAAVGEMGALVQTLTTEIGRATSPPPRPRPSPVLPAPKPPTPRPAPPRPVPAGATEIGRSGLRRILIALAQRPGLNNRQLGLRAGLSSKSGTFSTYLGKARSEGWIRDDGDRRFITDAGLASIGAFEPLPEGQALLEYWLGELGGGAARMLRALADVYPRTLTNEELGQAADISHGSGTFSTYLGKLRGLELIDGRGQLKASDELFG